MFKNNASRQALVVDDEFYNRDFVQILLEKAGFSVVSAANGFDAATAAGENPELSLALIDHELPDTTGVKLIAGLRTQRPDMMLVMATVHDDHELIEQAFSAGADMFIVKPNGFIELFKQLQIPDSKLMASDQRWIIDQYGVRPYHAKVKAQALPA